MKCKVYTVNSILKENTGIDAFYFDILSNFMIIKRSDNHNLSIVPSRLRVFFKRKPNFA